MIIIDGKKTAADLRLDLKNEVDNLKKKFNRIPGLSVILIGEYAPSKIYVRNKEKLAIEIKQIVEKNKASFAFPSQSIYVEKK